MTGKKKTRMRGWKRKSKGVRRRPTRVRKLELVLALCRQFDRQEANVCFFYNQTYSGNIRERDFWEFNPLWMGLRPLLCACAPGWDNQISGDT